DDLASFVGVARGHIHVIYNPVIAPDFDEKSRAAVDHPWLIKKEIPVIVSAGTLRPEKDFGTLIRAFDIASKKRSLRLLILGVGLRRSPCCYGLPQRSARGAERRRVWAACTDAGP